MNPPNDSEYSNSLSEVFGKIQEIAAESTDNNFIYRGEPEHYEKVSSSLWRKCEEEIGSEDFDIEVIQERMRDAAKNYTHEKDEFEILTQLQHYGGHTNLIDFTTDSHIALFFACSDLFYKSGRIILLQRTEEIDEKYQIKKPQNPQNRIIAQKSIFVRPPKGFIEPELLTEISIPESLKVSILDHLQRQHDISTQTIYNDLHGFIRNQNTHLKECVEVFEGETQPREDVVQIDPSQPSSDKDA
jgi:hypothetical protein